LRNTTNEILTLKQFFKSFTCNLFIDVEENRGYTLWNKGTCEPNVNDDEHVYVKFVIRVKLGGK